VKDAAIVMGTTTNKEILQKLGLLTDEGRVVDSQSLMEKARQRIEEMLLKPPPAKGRAFFSVVEIPSSVRACLKGTKTLHAAVIEAIRTAEPTRHTEFTKQLTISETELTALADKLVKALREEQRYIRGLYTGGTLAYETLVILGRMIGDVYSNAPLNPALKLANSFRSVKDSIVDLGEEEFTIGRAHPMIDPTVRKMRLVEEAKEPEVAVIIMYFMLGHGAHSDPAGAMLGAISDAKKIAEKDGRVLPMLARVCGTEPDPQPLSDQIGKLRGAGIEVLPTNALMAIASALISRKGKIGCSTMEDLFGSYLRGF
jgi:hypothetical protein